ncbi:MAG: O-antigen ligase family protein [Halioglobus sp.]
MFVLVLLLLKRSAVVAAMLVLALGWRSFFRRIRYQRFIFTAVFVVAGALYAGELLERLQSSEFVMERFSDLRKLEANQDIRYLGSGRLGLIERWWGYYRASSGLEMLFGQVVEDDSQITGNRYLGMSWPMPHNDVLDILLRGGLLALLVYLALIVLVYRAVFGRRNRARHLQEDMLQTIGRLALLVYLIHIPIGVITKLQFMTVIALYIGLAIRQAVDARKPA